MKLTFKTPKQSLNKAFLKQRPLRSEIDLFKHNLTGLLGKIDEIEREENQKTHIRDFLRDTYYKESNEINTKDSKDLVIHIGKINKDPVGVIVEAKRPSNKTEMLTADKPNTKAFQELVLYYLRERVEEKNNDIQYLVATNIYEWYIFEATYFEKAFFKNKAFVKQYEDWRDGKKVSKETSLFYNEIAKPFINTLEDEMPCTHFDIRTYETALKTTDKDDDKKLIQLFKILSPNHLLRVSFADDSNTLDEKFYKELLHIIGLEEAKDDSKFIIRRKLDDKRNAGSLLEMAIAMLETEDPLHKVTDIQNYGETKDEKTYNVALELCITWINRILFLKLLEGQLVNYHKGDKAYRFLNSDMIRDFDELYKLFHQVLAKTTEERSKTNKEKYGRVPYLNSSLFEISDLEDQTLKINQLDNAAQLELISSSILKEDRKKAAALPSLEYIFRFLDAYDFASEGKEDIQEDSKKLINASVLGKVFEKINGYKDGSVFTPGFITMYMCRQSIRLAVLQKFTDKYTWKVDTFDDLKNYLADKKSSKETLLHNQLINSLHICDPAVGSGHFLVSSLNEIIAIKSELGLLADEKGVRITDYEVTIENDELIVSDEEGEIFEYQSPLLKKGKSGEAMQRLQRTLFHEKQTIIENCLFGVDINPNSVKICRLRLWIELLKNAYYKQPDFAELETLPNIDINIKCGNSLLSRFPLDIDLTEAFKKQQFNLDTYKTAVEAYRKTSNKQAKAELTALIKKIKEEYTATIYKRDPRRKKLADIRGQIVLVQNNVDLFGAKKLTDDAKEVEERRLRLLLEQREKELQEAEKGVMYRGAFEWRFEFPEVLDLNGSYQGFDVIIANPPYVFARENFTPEMKDYFIDNYKTSQYQVNLFLLFIERAIPILKNGAQYSMIIPNSLLMVSSAKKLRNYLLQETALHEIINLMGNTFEGINVETIIISGKKESKDHTNKISIYINNGTEFILSHTKEQNLFMKNKGSELTVFSNSASDDLTVKLKRGSEVLDTIVKIKAGLQAYETGKGNPKQTPEDVKSRPYDYAYKFDKDTFEYLEGGDVCRYQLKWSGTFLRYGDNLAAPRTFDIFNGKKIILREITGKHPQSIIATYTEDIFLFNRSNIAIIENENSRVSLKYILAVLNSKLMSHYFVNNTAKSVRKLFPKLILEDLRKFPIKVINSNEQNPYITLVDKILSAKIEDKETKELEDEIDQLVYKLYDLTQTEIEIVESHEMG